MYARIKDFEIPLAYGTPEYNFVQAAETSSIGDFYELEKELEEALRPSDDLEQKVQELNDARLDVMSALANTNQVLLEANNSEDSLRTVALKIHQLDSIRMFKSAIDTIAEEIEERSLLALTNAKSLLDNISTSNAMESDWAFTLDLFIRRWIEGNEISKKDYDFLAYIANKCIAEGGDATSLARSMYYTIDPDLQFDDAMLCSPPPALAAPTPTGNAIVFPNPTTGEKIQLQTGWTEANTAEAMLFNALGQPVWQRTLELAGGNATFQLGHLPEGWYQLSLRAEGKQNVVPLMIQR